MVVVARKSSIEYWGTFLGAVAALATGASIVVRTTAASRERTGRIVDLHGERRGSAPLGQCRSTARTRQVGRRCSVADADVRRRLHIGELARRQRLALEEIAGTAFERRTVAGQDSGGAREGPI